MPSNMSQERRDAAADLRRRAGAGWKRAWKRRGPRPGRTGRRGGGAGVLDRFNNPANGMPLRSTGPEIWRPGGGAGHHFVSAMGTTGSTMGFLPPGRTRRWWWIGLQPAEGSQIPGIRPAGPRPHRPAIFEPAGSMGCWMTLEESPRHDAPPGAGEDLLRCQLGAGAVTGALRGGSERSGGVVVAIICDQGIAISPPGLHPRCLTDRGLLLPAPAGPATGPHVRIACRFGQSRAPSLMAIPIPGSSALSVRPASTAGCGATTVCHRVSRSARNASMVAWGLPRPGSRQSVRPHSYTQVAP